MHEMSITQGIIDLCLQYSRGNRVSAVTVEIGDLSGVMPDAVTACFEACSLNTLLEGARLHIIRIPGTGQCQSCGELFMLISLFDACKRCGEYWVTVATGEEMRVRDIDVED